MQTPELIIKHMSLLFYVWKCTSYLQYKLDMNQLLLLKGHNINLDLACDDINSDIYYCSFTFVIWEVDAIFKVLEMYYCLFTYVISTPIPGSSIWSSKSKLVCCSLFYTFPFVTSTNKISCLHQIGSFSLISWVLSM